MFWCLLYFDILLTCKVLYSGNNFQCLVNIFIVYWTLKGFPRIWSIAFQPKISAIYTQNHLKFNTMQHCFNVYSILTVVPIMESFAVQSNINVEQNMTQYWIYIESVLNIHWINVEYILNQCCIMLKLSCFDIYYMLNLDWTVGLAFIWTTFNV